MKKAFAAFALLVALAFALAGCTKTVVSAKTAQSDVSSMPQALKLVDIGKENSIFSTKFREVKFLDLPEGKEQMLAANFLLAMARGDVALKSYRINAEAVYPYIGHSMYKTFDITELTTLSQEEIQGEYLYNEPLTLSSLTPFAGGLSNYIAENKLQEPKMMRIGYSFTYTDEGKGIDYLNPEGRYVIYMLLAKDAKGEYRVADYSNKLLNFTPGKKDIPKTEINIFAKAENKAEQQIIDYYAAMAGKADKSGYPIYRSFSLDAVANLTDKEIMQENYFRQDLDVAPLFGDGFTYSQFCEKNGLRAPVMIKASFTYTYTDKAIVKGGQYPDGAQKQFFIAEPDENGKLVVLSISKL